MTDQTFSEHSLFGSKKWVALSLGQSVDAFGKALPALEAEGFPPMDPVIKRWIKADVEAWVNRRRRIKDNAIVATPRPHKEANYDRL